MPLLIAALVALSAGLASGQADPGFSPSEVPPQDRAVIGVWMHDAIQSHGQFAGARIWTRLELRADGEAVEDYFVADPALSDLPAAARLLATWTSGSYVDPEPAKGIFEVIRLAPYLSSTFNPDTGRYTNLSGLSLPIFRRFTLSPSSDEMTLSTSAFLGLEGSATVLSFPDDAEDRRFVRQPVPGTAVGSVSWGRLKADRR